MNRRSLRITATAVAAVALAFGFSVSPRAFATYSSWSSKNAVVYINPANPDGLAAADVVSALRAAMDDWTTQGGSGFSFTYGGQVNDTASSLDYRNVVMFRNESNGNIAYTYSWWDATNHLIDSDMLIYEPGYTYFAADGTCNSNTGYGVYLHDLTTHEFGHMLGLSHSSVATATMAQGYEACSTTQRSLDPDDIAAIQSLYGKGGTGGTSNTAPTLTIVSPVANGTYDSTAAVQLSATALDSQDGDLSSRVSWKSSAAGSLGVGTLSVLLPSGSQSITATVTDSGGMSTTKSVSVTVTAPLQAPAAGATLTVRGYKVRGVRRADLQWTNIPGAGNITRNGAFLKTVSGTTYTDPIGGKTSGTFTYQVCDSTGAVCTNSASATF
jgi:hypothetical protein